MKMRNFGKLGIQNSAFGLGCMRFTGKMVDGKNVTDDELAKNIIRGAIDGGVTYIDTAYVYIGGHSEEILGEALLDGYREKVNIATKIPPDRVQKIEDAEEILATELSRLQTDHIDFYLMHGLNKDKWEHAKAVGLPQWFDKLKAEGKIRYKCCSFHGSYEEFEYIIKDYDWDMVQIQYNFMDVENQAGTKGLELAGSLGIPVVIMEGLLGGKLANAPENVQAVYDAFPVKRSPVEWAFRFLQSHPEVGTILSGLTTMEQLEDNLAIFNKEESDELSPEEVQLFKDVRDAYNARTKIGCTGCRYCMPCPNGVDIPAAFRAWNNAFMYNNLGPGNWDYKRLQRDNASPEQCVECGACEAQCPQYLPIIESLKKVTEEIGG